MSPLDETQNVLDENIGSGEPDGSEALRSKVWEAAYTGATSLIRESKLIVVSLLGATAESANRETGLKMLESAGIGLTLRLLQRRAGIGGILAQGAGAIMSLQFLSGAFSLQRWRASWGAMSDALRPDSNMKADIEIMKSNLGRPIIDSGLMLVSTVLGAKCGQIGINRLLGTASITGATAIGNHRLSDTDSERPELEAATHDSDIGQQNKSTAAFRRFKLIDGQQALGSFQGGLTKGAWLKVREILTTADGHPQLAPAQMLRVEHSPATATTVSEADTELADLFVSCHGSLQGPTAVRKSLFPVSEARVGLVRGESGDDLVFFAGEKPPVDIATTGEAIMLGRAGDSAVSGKPSTVEAEPLSPEMQKAWNWLKTRDLSRLPESARRDRQALAKYIAEQAIPGSGIRLSPEMRARLAERFCEQAGRELWPSTSYSPVPPSELQSEIESHFASKGDSFNLYGYSAATLERAKALTFKVLSQRLPGRFPIDLHCGNEQIAVILNDQSVLKIKTSREWYANWGNRPDDCPMLRFPDGHSLLRVGSGDQSWLIYRQPEVPPPTESEARAFYEQHRREFADGGAAYEAAARQLGRYYDKRTGSWRTVVIDYESYEGGY